MTRFILFLFFASALASIGLTGGAQVVPAISDRDAHIDAVIESTTTTKEVK